MILTDDDLVAAERRARVFQGAWTGTSGTLAADSIRQIKYIRHLLAERQPMHLDATEAAHAATDAPSETEYERQAIPSDWILRGERELKGDRERPPMTPVMPTGFGVMADGGGREADCESERLLLDALEAVRDRRSKYGPPAEHFKKTIGMINACFGTSFKPEDWATIMELDKIARSQGPADCRDNDVDQAGYAACRAEVKHHSPS